MSTADKVLTALQQFDIRDERNGKYRCNSPLRPGSNSHGFSLRIEGPEHGAYFDHVTEERGSLYDLAKLLNITLPVSSPVQNTKRRYDGLEEYARSHGIEPQVLEAWHWRETRHKNRPALEIPTRTGTRWRFLDGKKPYYISEVNYQRCWYGLNAAVIELVKHGQPLVICNGEISTIAAQRHNLAAVAMTGGEKSEIPAALLAELRGKLADAEKLTIILAMDCDAAGRKAGRGIERQLRDEGLDATAVDLALSSGGDLADFCMLHTDSTRTALASCKRLEPGIEESDRRWRFASIGDVLAAPPISWLVPGMIPARGLTVLYGESGTYKSFLTLHYALTIAQKDPVVYIAAEGETGYRQRLEAWFKHHGEQHKTDKLTFVLGSVNLFADDDLYEFTRLAAAYKPKLIVADTLSMTIGEADTNSGRDMVAVFQACKRLIRELDTAIVLVHHTNAEGKRATGSQRIKDSVDTMIRLSRIDDVIAVESKKSKDTKLFETFYLREVQIPLGYKNNLGEDVTSLVLLPAAKVQREDDLTPQQRQLLEALEINPDQSYQELADLLEVSRNSIASTIRRLSKKGYIERTDTGYMVTTAGESALTDSSESGDSTDSLIQGGAGVSVFIEPGESHESVESVNHLGQAESPTQSFLINETVKGHYQHD